MPPTSGRASSSLRAWLKAWLRPSAPLTGLVEAPDADRALALAFEAARTSGKLAVVLIRFDAEATPAVQRGLGGLLRQQMRRDDTAARLEDGTFLVILPDCAAEGAQLFAERVQERLRASQKIVSVPNASVGIAVWVETMTSPAELLAAGRAALGAAQAAGGDRTRLFGGPIEAEAPPAVAAESIGRGRSALVLTQDVAAHARMLNLLRREEFAISTDSLEDHDLACIDLALGVEHIEARIREIRERAPAARIIVLCGQHYGMVPVAALRLRADAVCVSDEPESQLRTLLETLLSERDSRVSSAEWRARERQARHAAAASEARLRSVLQNIQEVIFATDRDGNWELLNPAWSALTGFPEEASVGLSMFEFVHEDDREKVRADFHALIESARPYLRREVRWRTRTGAYRWAELRLQPTERGTSGVLVDVTDRHRAEDALRQSERYFRSMIEHSADVMTAVNADGTIRYVSPAAEPLLGYAADDWVGRHILERVHPEDRDACVAEFQRLATKPEVSEDVELRMRHRDGYWIQLEVSGRNLLDEPGLEVILLSARDARARRRADAAAREREEALLRAQKMDAIARFAGEVAQDLGPVLDAVQEGRDLPGALARARALVARLRTIGRALPMQPVAVDMNGIVNRLRTELDVRDLAGIELVCRLAPDLQPAHADAAHVTRVLRELLANARAALPRGGTIEIVTRNCTIGAADPLAAELAAGDYTLTTVSDTGAGVPKQVFAQIFEPFVSTHAEENARGVGLAEAFGIVKQMQGHMAVESAPGWGTLVSIYLPAAN